MATTPMTGRRQQDRRTQEQQDDHDLLIKIETKLDSLSTSVHDSMQSTGQRLEALSAGKANMAEVMALRESLALKADAKEVNDHEGRIRGIENKVWKAIGGLSVLSIVTTILTILQWLKSNP